MRFELILLAGLACATPREASPLMQPTRLPADPVDFDGMQPCVRTLAE